MAISSDDTSLWSRILALLPAALPGFLVNQRWFGGKARTIRSVETVDAIPLTRERLVAHIILVRVRYTEGTPETYVLPFVLAPDERTQSSQQGDVARHCLPVQGEGKQKEVVLCDAVLDSEFAKSLLEAIAEGRCLKGTVGSVLALRTRAFDRIRGPKESLPEPSILGTEQSNTSILYGDRLILKLFRRVEEGINPEVEIGSFLTERTSFANISPVAGTLVYRCRHDEPMSMAVLQAFVPNQGDAWKYTLDALGQYFEQVAARQTGVQDVPQPNEALLAIEKALPQLAHELIGSYLESARLLGQRTAELHMALASNFEDPAFAPEPFSELYQRSVYQQMRNLTGQVFQLLRKRLVVLPEGVREQAQQVLDLEQEVMKRFGSVLERKINAMRTRFHGDFHLGQVLYTGKDFVIIDFEGEPARPISERRIKCSPLRDVAGMLRSFHYAAYTALFHRATGGGTRLEDIFALAPWARCWYFWVSAAFLWSYLDVAGEAAFIPQQREDLEILLRSYLLEKVIYELGYELNNRPHWVKIPLGGILQLLETG